MPTPYDKLLEYPPPDARNLFDFAAKSAAAFIGLSYILGLFIVNFYLARYGVRGLGLLRVDFVLAGSVFLLLFVLSWMLLKNVLAPLRDTGRSLIGRILRTIGRLLFSVVLLLIALVVISGSAYADGIYETLLRLVVLVSLAPVFLHVGAVWLALIKQLRDGHANDSPIFVLPFGIMVMIAGLAVYSVAVYPAISSAYGGGCPVPVRVMLTPSASVEAHQQLNQIVDKTKIAYLLAETPDWIVLGSQQRLSFSRNLNRCVQIRRSQVDTLVVEPTGNLRSIFLIN